MEGQNELSQSINIQKETIVSPKQTTNLLKNTFSKISSIVDICKKNMKEVPLPDNHESVLKKLHHRIKKFNKAVVRLSLVATVGMTLNYARTHESVEEKTINGETIYSHPDKKTTHILNYLAGKESLSQEEQINMIKNVCKVNIKNGGKTLPENFESMNMNELEQYMAINFPNDEATAVEEGNKSMLDEFLKSIPDSYTEDKELYKLIWETEKEGGASKIIFVGGGERHTFNFPHYNPYTNTVAIWPLYPHEIWITEMSHAKQYKDHPVDSTIKSIETALRIANKIITKRDLSEVFNAYDEEYRIQGSLEHEAHAVIEPYIKNKFEGKLPPDQ